MTARQSQRFAVIAIQLDTLAQAVVVLERRAHHLRGLRLRRFALGEASFYKPYMDVLPAGAEAVSPTFVWDEGELEALRGSPLLPATRSLQRKLRGEFERVVRPLVEEAPPRGGAPHGTHS